MSFIEVRPIHKHLKATIEIPGSKSYTNRALIMAVLTKGSVTLENPLFSEDTEAMIGCLRTLGLHIETYPSKIIVHDDISVVQDRSYSLFAKDSGTTMRFLLALLCLTPGTKILHGNARLLARPIKPLIDALHLLGAVIDPLSPLQILPSKLHHGIEIQLDASISSQFLSALLLIAPALEGLKIKLSGKIVSKPYVLMTLAAMRDWGVAVIETEGDSYYIPPNQQYQKDHYWIEGDFSSAGYFFAMATLTNSTITVRNLSANSLQADRKFLELLSRMGNEITFTKQEITLKGTQILPLEIDMEEYPDQVQTVAVLAAFTKGVTKIRGVRTLRVKETERVKALKNELRKMGIETEDTFDTLTIYGGNPKPATIETYGDHRMAMAFAVAGTKLPGMKIRNPEVVRKTFPSFWETLESL